MYCPKCGASVAAGLAFCSTCGANLQTSTPQQPPPVSPVYAAPFRMPHPRNPPNGCGTTQPGERAPSAISSMRCWWAPGWPSFTLWWAPRSLRCSILRVDEASGTICCMMIMLFPLATFIVGIYNSVYLIAQRGYSIGQGVVKVMVVDGAGNLLTTGSAWIRLLVRVAFGFVPFLPLLDLLWPLWDVRRQTLHDKAVNCYVINMR